MKSDQRTQTLKHSHLFDVRTALPALLLAAIAGPLAFSTPARGQATVTWTGSNTTWNQPDTDSFNAQYASGDTAVFAGAGQGTVTIGSGVTPGQVNVTDGSYTFSGSGLGGTGGLAKSGTGTLTLANANTFSGSTTVTSGTLLLTNTDALQSSTFSGGAGTLAFGNSLDNCNLGGLAGSSTIVPRRQNQDAIQVFFGRNNQDTNFSGNVDGQFLGFFIDSASAYSPLSMLKVGTGTTTISGTWTLGLDNVTSDGFVSVQVGTLRQTAGSVSVARTQFSGGLLVGSLAGSTGTYTLDGGTLLAFNSSGPVNARIGLGGTGVFNINGGSARLAGTNNNLGGRDGASTSGTGTINLGGGELAVNSLTTSTNAGSQGFFNFSGGTLRPYSQDTSIGASGSGFTIALSGTGATLSGLDVSGTSRTLTVLTTMGGSGSVTVNGGRVTVAAANSFNGTTTISAGTLALAASGSFASSPTITVASGGTLDLTSKTSGFAFGSGQTLAGSGEVALPTSGSGVSLAGTLAPGGGSVGTLAFTGAGTFDIGSATAIQFGLGTTLASDLVTVSSGTLAIGSGLLNFDDFAFTPLAGFGPGTYTLFSAGSITGSLGTTSGTISGFDSTLAVSGGELQLVVVPEPETVLLAGLGLAAAAATLRRRRLRAG
jgi:fibronectin-binding autotransporter adhesin